MGRTDKQKAKVNRPGGQTNCKPNLSTSSIRLRTLRRARMVALGRRKPKQLPNLRSQAGRSGMDRYKSQGGVGLLDLRCGAVCIVEDLGLIYDTIYASIVYRPWSCGSLNL